MPFLRVAGGSELICGRFAPRSTVDRDIKAFGYLSAGDDARSPKAIGAAPMIRNDPDAPPSMTYMRPIRSEVNSRWGHRGFWTTVRWRRRLKPEGNWGRPDHSERPRRSSQSELICARFSPRSTGDQKSGSWGPLHAGRVSCIHRPAGAMSPHRPRFAAGTGRGTR